MSRIITRTIIVLLFFIAYTHSVSSQTIPQIEEVNKMFATVKYKGEYKTITLANFVEALAKGEATKLPLPYTAERRNDLLKMEKEFKIKNSQMEAMAGSLGSYGQSQMESNRLQLVIMMTAVFDGQGGMEFIVKKFCDYNQ